VEEYEDAVVPHPHHGKFLSTGHTFYRTDQKFTLSRRELSSQADSSSKKEDDEVDDDDDNDGVEIEDRLAEPDLSDGDDGDDGGKLQDELDLSDTMAIINIIIFRISFREICNIKSSVLFQIMITNVCKGHRKIIVFRFIIIIIIRSNILTVT
jgi:hypothetical protein